MTRPASILMVFAVALGLTPNISLAARPGHCRVHGASGFELPAVESCMVTAAGSTLIVAGLSTNDPRSMDAVESAAVTLDGPGVSLSWNTGQGIRAVVPVEQGGEYTLTRYAPAQVAMMSGATEDDIADLLLQDTAGVAIAVSIREANTYPCNFAVSPPRLSYKPTTGVPVPVIGFSAEAQCSNLRQTPLTAEVQASLLRGGRTGAEASSAPPGYCMLLTCSTGIVSEGQHECGNNCLGKWTTKGVFEATLEADSIWLSYDTLNCETSDGGATLRCTRYTSVTLG